MKTKITGEEKHYEKLNKKLSKEINELKEHSAKLLKINKILFDKINALSEENDKLINTL